MRSVAEVGYVRATIREIARTAGTTSGSLYHYFPNKSELVKAAFGEIADVAVPRLTEAATGADGVVGKLTALFDEAAGSPGSIRTRLPSIARFGSRAPSTCTSGRTPTPCSTRSAPWSSASSTSSAGTANPIRASPSEC
nr:helix-turn-helix domain-containing protein [Rhodococcus phenolicus]